MTGTLYGIGVGPGDPELITLKAVRILQSAAVVAYPAPERGDSLARKIAAPHVPDGRDEIVIRMPLDPKHFPDRSAFDDGAARIADALRRGDDVAVLCEGDPFFYGSFMYLFSRLAVDFRAEIVPGVSSLTACAAEGLAPLAARNEVLSILPAPLTADALKVHIERSDTTAIIKLGRHAPKVFDVLKELGLFERARYIAHATLPEQRVHDLIDVDPGDVPYFAMILVRKAEIGR